MIISHVDSVSLDHAKSSGKSLKSDLKWCRNVEQESKKHHDSIPKVKQKPKHEKFMEENSRDFETIHSSLRSNLRVKCSAI